MKSNLNEFERKGPRSKRLPRITRPLLDHDWITEIQKVSRWEYGRDIEIFAEIPRYQLLHAKDIGRSANLGHQAIVKMTSRIAAEMPASADNPLRLKVADEHTLSTPTFDNSGMLVNFSFLLNFEQEKALVDEVESIVNSVEKSTGAVIANPTGMAMSLVVGRTETSDRKVIEGAASIILEYAPADFLVGPAEVSFS